MLLVDPLVDWEVFILRMQKSMRKVKEEILTYQAANYLSELLSICWKLFLISPWHLVVVEIKDPEHKEM